MAFCPNGDVPALFVVGAEVIPNAFGVLVDVLLWPKAPDPDWLPKVNGLLAELFEAPNGLLFVLEAPKSPPEFACAPKGVLEFEPKVGFEAGAVGVAKLLALPLLPKMPPALLLVLEEFPPPKMLDV